MYSALLKTRQMTGFFLFLEESYHFINIGFFIIFLCKIVAQKNKFMHNNNDEIVTRKKDILEGHILRSYKRLMVFVQNFTRHCQKSLSYFCRFRYYFY